MKREFLEELGLEKEAIDKVMAEHGKGIESIKAEKLAKETEVETLQGQLKTANEQIEEFKDLDVDEIKAKADEYKSEYEKLQTESEEKLAAVQFEHELENAIRDSNARNVTAVKALLDVDSLRGSNNRLDDIKQALEETKEANGYLFEVEQAGDDDSPKFSRPGGSAQPMKMTREEFNKLSYVQRNEMFTKDRSLYDELTK